MSIFCDLKKNGCSNCNLHYCIHNTHNRNNHNTIATATTIAIVIQNLESYINDVYKPPRGTSKTTSSSRDHIANFAIKLAITLTSLYTCRMVGFPKNWSKYLQSSLKLKTKEGMGLCRLIKALIIDRKLTTIIARSNLLLLINNKPSLKPHNLATKFVVCPSPLLQATTHLSLLSLIIDEQVARSGSPLAAPLVFNL